MNRIFTQTEMHKRDAILGSYARKTARRMQRLARHFALLRWVRGVR